ncbi:hypothetical protein OPV22_009846 [Ensete ventricosum]|uniref:DUF4005 domain-containing protein n=1 Tax=Ensete ventricosum TaxID=4639 RepID=A0AAV8RBS8_ENSVE|nr:hypothetical protein OPV22_009846 [Ensete ventricosum]
MFPLTYVGNQFQEEKQLQEQEENVSDSIYHEVTDKTGDVSLGSHADLSTLVKNNDMLLRQPPINQKGDAVDQSVETSFPIPADRVSPSSVGLVPDSHGPAYPAEMDLRKAINAGGFHVKSSDLQLPVKETRSGPQPPITGRSQQRSSSVANFLKPKQAEYANNAVFDEEEPVKRNLFDGDSNVYTPSLVNTNKMLTRAKVMVQFKDQRSARVQPQSYFHGMRSCKVYKSMTELSGTWASNSLIEKVGDEAERINSPSMLSSRRSLTLTTQMIQQL